MTFITLPTPPPSCVCPSSDPCMCVRMRYRMMVDEVVDDPCDCVCHDGDDSGEDDDDEEEVP